MVSYRHLFTSIALEWKQPIGYILELSDMNPIWDVLDLFNPETEEDTKLAKRQDRHKAIEEFRKAQSKRIKQEG